MEQSWELKAIELRNAARDFSRALRKTLKPARKVPRGAGGGLRAGVARVDITPDQAMYLDGYWRDRLTTKVHDPLSAKALVLDDGRTRIALVVADLIAFFHPWVREARAQQTAVPPENVVICTTHTHSSPCVLGMFGPPGAVDMDYVRACGRAMAQAVEEAATALRPARVGFGEGHLPLENGEIPDFARNWHNPGVVDTAVPLMRVVGAEDDAPIATVINLGNHTDVLGEFSTEVSADFLAYVYERVGAELGGEALVFQRGLGGVEPIPQGVNDMAEAEPFLRKVADVACGPIFDAAERLEWADDARVTIRTVPTAFPITSGEALKMYAAGLSPLEMAEPVLHNEMHLIEIGPAQFLTVPGEPHPEVIFKLADMMPTKWKFVLGMAEDEIGYVVPAELFNPGGIQELLSTGRDNERVVLDAAARLLGVDAFVEPACFVMEQAETRG